MSRIDELLARDGLLHEMPKARRQELQGEIMELFMSSRLHRGLTLTEFAASILPPLHFNQFRIYRDSTKAVGFVSWAYFSEESARGYMAGNFDFTIDRWTNGKHIWFIDFIAPFGHAIRIFDDMRRNVFPDEVGFGPELGRSPDQHRVRKFYGINVRRDEISAEDRDFLHEMTR